MVSLVDVRDAVGRSPLHYAAAAGAVRAVRILLAGGAQPNLADGTGRTPLHYTRRALPAAACSRAAGGPPQLVTHRSRRSPAVASALIEHGARAELADGAVRSMRALACFAL